LTVSKRKMWTESDVEYLKANYPTKEAIEIAQDLGRTLASVQVKAEKLSLKKKFITRKSRRVSVDSDAKVQAQIIKDILKPNSYEYSFTEIAIALNISVEEAIETFDKAIRRLAYYVRHNEDIAQELTSLIREDEDFMEWDFVV